MRNLLLALAIPSLFLGTFQGGVRAAGEGDGAGAIVNESGVSSKVPVTFSGGHDTDPQDRGRPVVLIAAALNVPPTVFRKAFSDVRPARGGQAPEPAQVARNKETLLRSLGPYGITNDRLDEVSNYYRYNRSRGETVWRATEATAFATVRDGMVTGFTVTNPGSGYSSPPQVSVPGVRDLNASVALSFGTDLKTNGSIKEIKLGAGTGQTTKAPPTGASDAPGENEREPSPPPRPPGAGPLQDALNRLHLTDEEMRKIEPILEEHRRKQEQLREALLKQIKDVLNAKQYDEFESAVMQPPPPPPAEGRDPNRNPN